MHWIYSLNKAPDSEAHALGGKGAALKRLLAAGCTIPPTVCIPTRTYDTFVNTTGLREKILMELNRKDFADMRWEEIWDASLRIRNLFATTALPDHIDAGLTAFLDGCWPEKPVAVRSSAPDEDAGDVSFAGLHESYLNIRGTAGIVKHVKKVWSSLWSDRALLYRQELKLDVQSSSMAVVIQQLIPADCSGIVFTQAPDNRNQLVIEAVHGLNEGLVDGDIEPDRWFLSRKSKTVLKHQQPSARSKWSVPARHGIKIKTLDPKKAPLSPLSANQVEDLAAKALELENELGTPLDIEWSYHDDMLYILQARPITTLHPVDGNDKRSWYLSLHRSYENLRHLRHEIEHTFLPQMNREAEELSARQLSALSDHQLADEIEQRKIIYDKWTQTYWSEFIPFAHGVRLFGEVYNDLMSPEDPYAFVALLRGQKMLSTDRNEMLLQLGRIVREDRQLQLQIRERNVQDITNTAFADSLHNFEQKFGNPFISPGEGIEEQKATAMLAGLILEYSGIRMDNPDRPDQSARMTSTFLQQLEAAGLPFDGRELLELARASYRLRDDDNIHLGKIEQQFKRALAEGAKRLNLAGKEITAIDEATICALLKEESGSIEQGTMAAAEPQPARRRRIRARQLLGQPASPGIARGAARVIRSGKDLAAFKQGEILVVDAIDPNMTFIVPLCRAIVERRGGMLIHGAIIAREYGVPCITGVKDAVDLIANGTNISVDGYLGIVTIAGNEKKES